MDTRNIALAVLERAKQQPNTPAFVAPGHSISYERAASLIVNFARCMRDCGVTRESVVAFSIKGLPTATMATLAVALLGARWQRPGVIRSSVTHYFADGGDASRLGAIPIDRSWYDAPPVPAQMPFAGYSSPDDVWMIGESSGTTGVRKLIPITYGTVWRRVLVPETQEDATAVTLNLFPALGAHGARVNVGTLVAGGTNVSQAPWKELLDLGVNRVTGSPWHVMNLLFKRSPAERRIRSVKVAGSSVTRQFVENVLLHAEEVHLAYGATEVGAVARYAITHPGQFDGSVGQPNDGAAFEIVDEAGQLLPAGEEGVVRVRSGWMVDGYLDEPELTASIFRDGWFYPGDAGFIDARGALHITGRTNDVINVNGVKFNASTLDEVIQQQPGVADGYCFAETDTNGATVLCAIVSLQPGEDRADVEALGRVAKEKLGLSKSPRRIYVVESVPRNEGGKPLRADARELAAQHEPIEIPWPA